jgi:hypothetical protein
MMPREHEWLVHKGRGKRAAIVIHGKCYWIYDEKGTAVKDAKAIVREHYAAVAAAYKDGYNDGVLKLPKRE